MNVNDNTYYESETRKIPWFKIILIIVFISIIIFLLILMRSGKKANPYDTLYTEVKNYLNTNNGKYPNAIGETTDIKLSELSSDVQQNKSLKTCNTEESYVKISKIDEDNYQYTVILSCDGVKTDFNDWLVGTSDNLKQGNSDVEFRYIPEEQKNGTKLYYPDDEKNANKISTYYITSPSDGYDKIDSPVVAYKWYSDTIGKDYYNDGEYVPTEPSGYSLKDDKQIKKYGSLTKPKEETYRTIEEGAIYAIEYVAYPYKFECYDSNIAGTIITPTLCEVRESKTFKKTKVVHYTCDGKTDVEENTICKDREDWVADSCVSSNQTGKGNTKEGYSYTRNILTGYTCISTNGYRISDEVWRWYKEDNVKQYYPSLSTIGKEENTYYISVPTSGVMKDESSISYAYKFYKFVEDKDASKEWVSLTNQSLTKEEMIDMFIKTGYEVNTLEDIEKNENIRYQIEISYKDRK